MEQVLLSTSFIEKALLLIIGLALTGILVPVLKRRIDQDRFKQEKEFEAELTKQARIMEARDRFLRELADPLWQYQLLALQVSYHALNDEEKLSKAFAAYDEFSWKHLIRIRSLIGGARWFTSIGTYELLADFVDKWLLVDIDHRLVRLIRGGKSPEWRDFHDWLYAESRKKTDKLLVALADEYGLTPPPSPSTQK